MRKTFSFTILDADVWVMVRLRCSGVNREEVFAAASDGGNRGHIPITKKAPHN